MSFALTATDTFVTALDGMPRTDETVVIKADVKIALLASEADTPDIVCRKNIGNKRAIRYYIGIRLYN